MNSSQQLQPSDKQIVIFALRLILTIGKKKPHHKSNYYFLKRLSQIVRILEGKGDTIGNTSEYWD